MTAARPDATRRPETANTLRSVGLSALLVVSVVAIAVAGGVAGQSVGQADTATNGTAEVNATLLDEAADGPVTAVVRLAPADQAALTGDTDEVVAGLKRHADEAQQPVLAYAREDNTTEVLTRLWITNAVVVETDADGLSGLASVAGVDRIHPNYEYSVPETERDEADIGPDQQVTYGVNQIDAPRVWDELDNRGEGARVAVLDTGVDESHPDMPALTDDQWGHWDDSGNPIDSEPTDGEGHGTHVSGTVVGPQEPDGDVPGYGVAPEATLYHGKVLDDSGSGTYAQIAAGMQWTVDEVDVDVVSMSLGGGPADAELIEAVENVWAAGLILVASNGNNNIGAPGTYWSTFGSQAVDESEQPAGFADSAVIEPASFFGTDIPDHWPEEYLTPHASAAGVGVLSAQAGGGYTSLSGTSMSAPHHAGMFALMVSQAQGEFDLEEFRAVALETARDPPSDDDIYGQGISDAYAAVSAVNPVNADTVLGDVTESGAVTLTDALRVYEEADGVRDPETDFFEPAADLDRDGEITDTDAALAQERVAGTLDESSLGVTGIDAPVVVEGGTEIEVSADIENLGELGALSDLEWRIAPVGEPLDEDATLVTKFVDVAAPGVSDPVSLPASATVDFSGIDTGQLAGGDYNHGVFATNSNATGTLTINAPFFEVTSLDAPADVPTGENFTVAAEITNTGNDGATRPVTYEFPAVGVNRTTTVSLNASESTTLTFENIEADTLPDEYEHSVETPDDEVVAPISVVEPFFSVTDLVAPEAVNVGDEITVNATVENTGGLADEQEITYELSNQSLLTVAVVNEAPSVAEMADRLADRTDLSAAERTARAAEIQSAANLSDFLASELDDEAFKVVDVPAAALMNNTDHDVYVINQFTEDNDAGAFLDQLDESQATVHLDGYGDSIDDTTDGIVRLVKDVGDPTELEGSFIAGGGADLHIGESHPILDGVGEPGEVVSLHNGQDADRTWYSGYSGQNLAQVSSEGDTPDGPTVGVNDNKDQILLGSSGRDVYTPHTVFTDAENTLMLNAVRYAAFEQRTGSFSTTAGTASNTTVSLGPGESTQVSFEYTVQESDVDAVSHRVNSADDRATAPATIAADEQVSVVGFDTAKTVAQGETLEVTVTLEHLGTEPTTQDVNYLFDGAVEDTTTVSLDPGDTTTVTLGTAIPDGQEPGSYEHGVSLLYDEQLAVVEVVAAGTPFFEVGGFDAPDEVDPGEEIQVNATVENVGTLPATQTVEYQFDVETPELTPLDVALVDLGDPDGDRNGGQLAEVLRNRLDDEDSVTSYFEPDSEDWADAVVNNEHDVHVIYDIADRMDFFLEQRGQETTGVLLDNYGDGSSQFESNAVFALSLATGNPAFVLEAVTGDGPPATMTPQTDHPIFEGVAAVGEEIPILAKTEGGGMMAWMENYEFEEIATGSITDPDEGEVGGTTAAIDNERGLVIQSQLGAGVFEYTDNDDDPSPFYNESFELIVNSIEYAASGELTPIPSLSEPAADNAGTTTGSGETDTGDGSAESGETDTGDESAESGDSLQVAVVELAHTGGGSHGVQIADILDNRLSGATVDTFFKEAIDGGENVTAWKNTLNDYDIHVVQSWGTHRGDTGTEHAAYFAENVDNSTAAVVLDSQGTTSTLHADGITAFGNVTGDPGVVETDTQDFDDGAWLHAETAHPIFEGVVSAGESALMVNTADDAGQFVPFSNTDAEVIGTGRFGENGQTVGDTLAVDIQRQVVFNGMFGGDIWDPAEYTDDAKEMLANTVAYADEKLLAEDEQFVSLDPGESETVTLNVTVPEADAGEYGHGIFSENDSDTAAVTLLELDEYALSSLDPADGEAAVGDDPIDVTVDVENVGAEPGDQTLALDIVDNETGDTVYTDSVQNVTVAAGETQTVTFPAVPVGSLDRGNYTHTVTSDDDIINGSLAVFEPVFFEVSDLEAPADVIQGESFDVSANVTNGLPPGSSVAPAFTGTQTVEFVFDGAVEDTTTVTLAAGETTTVTFEDIPATVAAGSYEHGIQTANDSQTATVEVFEGAEYLLSNLNPADAEVNDQEFINVSVDVENAGDTAQALDVDLDVVADGGEGPVVFDDTLPGVEVAPGENETVTFTDVPVDALDPGDYEHRVSTPQDSLNGTLTVLGDGFFAVTDLVAPAEVQQGGTVTVSANVTNGEAPGPDGTVVTVVDSAFAPDQAGALVDHLDSELGPEYILQERTPAELLTSTDSDVYVIQEFGNTSAEAFLGFLDDDQAVVALDQAGDGADAVESIVADVGDPSSFASDIAGGPGAEMELTGDHPILDGVGSPGETLTYHTGFDADRAWFEGYSGEVYGEIAAPADEIDAGGPAIGVDDSTNRVLLPSSARTRYVIHDEYTAAEHTLVVNAVEYAATEQAGVTAGSADEVTADNATQTVEYRVGGQTLASKVVSLDPGETRTVTFENVGVDSAAGEYEQGVYSQNDSATTALTVTASEPAGSRSLVDPTGTTAVEATQRETGIVGADVVGT